MTKRFIKYTGLLLTLAGMYSCSEANITLDDAEGRLTISTGISSDLSVGSRASGVGIYTDEELLGMLTLQISKPDGTVEKEWKPFTTGNAGNDVSVTLREGEYKVTGVSGEKVAASFKKQYYKGETNVIVTGHKETKADLTCRIANVVTDVAYDDKIPNYLGEIEFAVKNSEGSLSYYDTDDCGKYGYFVMPDGENQLQWSLTGVLRDGTAFEKVGTQSVKEGYLYNFSFTFNPTETAVGGAAIKLSVDETSLITKEATTTFRAAPNLYYGSREAAVKVDENFSLAAVKNSVAEIQLDVRSSGYLTQVTLFADDAISTVYPQLSTGVDLLTGNDINGDFITVSGLESDVDSKTSRFAFSILPALCNNLEDGEYKFSVISVDREFDDADGLETKTSNADFLLIVADGGAKVRPMTRNDRESLEPRRALLRGQILGNDIVKVGFKIREITPNPVDWNDVDIIEATPANYNISTEFTAFAENLWEGHEHEYKVVFQTADNSSWAESNDVETLHTIAPQLPNSDMEYWSKVSGAYYAYDSSADEPYWTSPDFDWVTSKAPGMNGSSRSQWWDSGNSASASFGTGEITSPSSEYAHSGNYSARLQTKYAVIKIAAGSLFAGKFVSTKNLSDGVLGWGRPFIYRPKSLKVWVKYNPEKVTSSNWVKDNPFGIAMNSMDQGKIYVALLDDKMDYSVNEFPVRTDTSAPKTFFDKDNWTNIISYGEVVLDKTEGPDGGMVQIEINLEPKPGRENEIPSYIMIVCSSSIAGDYYCGAAGSTLWLDDFELVY